jgi:hypothetical protein
VAQIEEQTLKNGVEFAHRNLVLIPNIGILACFCSLWVDFMNANIWNNMPETSPPADCEGGRTTPLFIIFLYVRFHEQGFFCAVVPWQKNMTKIEEMD